MVTFMLMLMSSIQRELNLKKKSRRVALSFFGVLEKYKIIPQTLYALGSARVFDRWLMDWLERCCPLIDEGFLLKRSLV